MTCQITVADDGNYIIQVVTGEINRKLAMEYNVESHILGKKLGINKYLVDLRETRNTDTLNDSYDFAYKDMRTTDEIDRFAKVALLVSPEDNSHDFIETVARNNGLDVTIFRDHSAAIDFLAEK